jgi:hypothetical protein
MPDIVPANERCDFCRNKKATRLCDYPVGHWVSPHMVAKFGKIITCDAKMCDACATKLGFEVDFCPKCMEEVKKLKRGD